MKFQLKKIVAFMALALAFTSCSKDDDPVLDTTPTGTGSIVLEFDNVYKDANLILGTTNVANSNGELLNVNKIKYIVSNIILTKADGTTYIVPQNDSYFIVDESIASSQEIEIDNIPAGDYTAVKFGIGVDEAKFLTGQTGQGDFLATATTAGMFWTWATGYRYLVFEGEYTTATQTTAAQYQVHTGKVSTDYNYRDISLTFPSSDKANIRTTITPQVHIKADLAVILDGTSKLKLSEGASIMGGTKVKSISDNLLNMFSVAHVHND